ncbi:pectinesterase family protein [Cellvibrio mixtus]|uniref:pectinesterase family protein n=1 Tax=Cellvibrio mixtus TaxID=39650 RepID=UPI000B039184|nr:pectinesterase family protein [Cellvibrio mixtus]
MMLRFVTVLMTVLFFSGCAGVKPYDAVVDKNNASQHQLGKKNFSSVQAALEAAPTVAKKPYRIFIAPGDYYEKLTIAKPNIHLMGADKKNTRIYYNAYAGQQSTETGATKGQIWGTPGSATVIIRAANIHIQQLTIENTFDFLANDALANDDPQRIANTQAVALHLDNGSDRFVAREVRLLGYQDTLFVNAGRSWFDKSLIAGNVDFIFGKGNALFTHSEIKTRGRGKPSVPHAYLVAPSTQISSEYGLTFIDCILTRSKSVPDNSVPLGRPWHPTTQFTDGRYADPNAIGKAVFINSWMDKHITLDGWDSMSGTAKDGTRTKFLPEDSRFFESNSKGPGAAVNRHRRQLSAEEIKHYSTEKILGDWKPE